MQKEPYKLKAAKESIDSLSQYRTKAHDNWSILEDFGLFLWPA